MADSAPSSPSAFPGFDRPRQNWFKMPNAWTDITAGISSLAELKVIEYVLKHTWGYQEFGIPKQISLTEFMTGRRRKDGSRIDQGTGLTRPSVRAGLKAAVEHGYLEKRVDASDKARIRTYYSLRMRPDLAEEIDNQQHWPEQHWPEEPPAPDDDEDGDDALVPDHDPDDDPDGDRGGKNLSSGGKNLSRGGKNLSLGGKESFPRSEKDTLERHQQQENNNNMRAQEDPSATPDVVVVALLARGISRPVARRLARLYPADYVRAKEAYLDFLVDARPHEVKKPAAWLRKAIEDDYSAPDGFISPADREQAIAAEKRRNEALVAAQEREWEARAAAEEAHKQALAAKRARLHAHFGTRPEDVALWQAVSTELSHGSSTLYALVATAEILQVDAEAPTGARVRLGIPHPFQLRELQHPRLQMALARAFKHHVRKELAIELTLIADDALEELLSGSPILGAA